VDIYFRSLRTDNGKPRNFFIIFHRIFYITFGNNLKDSRLFSQIGKMHNKQTIFARCFPDVAIVLLEKRLCSILAQVKSGNFLSRKYIFESKKLDFHYHLNLYIILL